MYKLRGGNHWDAQDRTWPVLALARSSLHHQVRQAAPADWHVGVIELVEHVRYQPTYNLASSPCQVSEQWKKTCLIWNLSSGSEAAWNIFTLSSRMWYLVTCVSFKGITMWWLTFFPTLDTQTTSGIANNSQHIPFWWHKRWQHKTSKNVVHCLAALMMQVETYCRGGGVPYLILYFLSDWSKAGRTKW